MSGILYPILILTLFLIVQILTMMASRKTVLDKNKQQLLDSVNASNKIYSNEELSILLDEQRNQNTQLLNQLNELTNKFNSLNNRVGKIETNQTQHGGDYRIHNIPFGKYFNSDTRKYVLIKLGNLKLSNTMILVTLKVYQYDYFNTINIGAYAYKDRNEILSPRVSYLQKNYKYPAYFLIKDNTNEIYLALDKTGSNSSGGYTGFVVDEIATFHQVPDDISNGWQMTTTDSLNGFRIYPCAEY